MSHMFCTLREAARTLNASEDEIQALLERGLLREFREGPHRLLKEAEVGALARQQAQRRERESAAPSPLPAEESSPPRDRAARAGRRPPDRMSPPGRRRTPCTDRRSACSPEAPATTLRRPDPRPSGRLPLRQWFWMGLVQDRPGVIALLSALVLALLAAVAAGLSCLVRAS